MLISAPTISVIIFPVTTFPGKIYDGNTFPDTSVYLQCARKDSTVYIRKTHFLVFSLFLYS